MYQSENGHTEKAFEFCVVLTGVSENQDVEWMWKTLLHERDNRRCSVCAFLELVKNELSVIDFQIFGVVDTVEDAPIVLVVIGKCQKVHTPWLPSPSECNAGGGRPISSDIVARAWVKPIT